jgi:hypothetical protein
MGAASAEAALAAVPKLKVKVPEKVPLPANGKLLGARKVARYWFNPGKIVPLELTFCGLPNTVIVPVTVYETGRPTFESTVKL